MQVSERGEEQGSALLETLVALSILLICVQGYLGLNYVLLKRISASSKNEKALVELEKEIALVHWQVKKGNLDKKICSRQDKTRHYIYANCAIRDKTYLFSNF